MVQASDLTMRSGGPNSFVAFHSSAFGHCRGRGMSLRSPRGAPPSTHRTMVSTCAWLRDMSFVNFWAPTVGLMFHGGFLWGFSRDGLAFSRVGFALRVA